MDFWLCWKGGVIEMWQCPKWSFSQNFPGSLFALLSSKAWGNLGNPTAMNKTIKTRQLPPIYCSSSASDRRTTFPHNPPVSGKYRPAWTTTPYRNIRFFQAAWNSALTSHHNHQISSLSMYFYKRNRPSRLDTSGFWRFLSSPRTTRPHDLRQWRRPSDSYVTSSLTSFLPTGLLIPV